MVLERICRFGLLQRINDKARQAREVAGSFAHMMIVRENVGSSQLNVTVVTSHQSPVTSH